jgi:hypothetical protein
VEHVRAEQSVYAASVRLAGEEVEAGSLIRARALLDHALASPNQAQSAGWEYRQLWARCYADLPTIFGTHDSWISAIAVSPDGHWAASLSEDGMAKLWEVPAGRDPHRWEAHGAPSAMRPGYPGLALAFAPDSQTLATVGRDRIVRLWDLHSPGKERATELEPLPGLCTGLAFSGPRSLLVALGMGGRVTLWSLADPVPVKLIH